MVNTICCSKPLWPVLISSDTTSGSVEYLFAIGMFLNVKFDQCDESLTVDCLTTFCTLSIFYGARLWHLLLSICFHLDRFRWWMATNREHSSALRLHFSNGSFGHFIIQVSADKTWKIWRHGSSVYQVGSCQFLLSSHCVMASFSDPPTSRLPTGVKGKAVVIIPHVLSLNPLYSITGFYCVIVHGALLCFVNHARRLAKQSRTVHKTFLASIYSTFHTIPCPFS